jgi:adenosylcobyric acid synthase
MMGQSLHDPHHVESAESDMWGLELFPVVTRFNREKTTVQVKAVHLESQLPVAGYEIHMGETQNLNGARPLFQITERQGKSVDAMDGLTSGTGGARLWGTYIHGLFDLPGFRRHFLDQIREHYGLNPFKTPETSPSGFFENPYDRLARTVEDNIDMNLLSGILEEQLL